MRLSQDKQSLKSCLERIKKTKYVLKPYLPSEGYALFSCTLFVVGGLWKAGR